MGRDETTVYKVHLTSDPTTDDSQPIETEHIDYYDSGLWVHVEEGRDFYPYERIEVIQEREREQPAVEADEAAETDEEGYVHLEDQVEAAEHDVDEEGEDEEAEEASDEDY